MDTVTINRADKLAADKSLSRETQSITQDKNGLTFMVEQVTLYGIEDGVGTVVRRRDQFYYVAKNPDLTTWPMACKALATLQFCGELPIDGEATAPTPAAKVAPVPRTARKKTAAKAAPAAAAPEADPETETPQAAPPATNVMYHKPDRGHAAFAKEVIARVIGADWGKNEEKKTAVKKLVAGLHGKVPVTDAAGNVLESFKAYTEKFLMENYTGGQTEEDVI